MQPAGPVLAPSHRRLRHVTGVLARNLTPPLAATNALLHATYFSLHLLPPGQASSSSQPTPQRRRVPSRQQLRVASLRDAAPVFVQRIICTRYSSR